MDNLLCRFWLRCVFSDENHPLKTLYENHIHYIVKNKHELAENIDNSIKEIYTTKEEGIIQKQIGKYNEYNNYFRNKNNKRPAIKLIKENIKYGQKKITFFYSNESFMFRAHKLINDLTIKNKLLLPSIIKRNNITSIPNYIIPTLFNNYLVITTDSDPRDYMDSTNYYSDGSCYLNP